MKTSEFVLILSSVLFVSCNPTDDNSRFTGEDAQPYIEQGRAVTGASFQALSSNLKKAMMRGGVEEAASFCNIAAQPITDSLSTAHGVVIKRTSLKLRNPDNRPDNLEQTVLDMFTKIDGMGKLIEPKILLDGEGKVRYFAPIMVKSQCLQCHGVLGESLPEENYKFIQARYPADQATGYQENDLRGIWSITFARTPDE
jgi:hypothetical protein